MKLGIWSSYYIELSAEEALLELAKHGYHYTELSDEHSAILMDRGDPAKIGAQFSAFAADCGMQLPQGHLLLNAHITAPDDLNAVKKQLDLFQAIGVKRAVLHCDSLLNQPELTLEQKRHKNVDALQQLIRHIHGTDMVICLENLGKNSFVQSAEDLLYFVQLLGSDQLGICLDTGHLNLTNCQSQQAFIQAAGKHIKALHLADNNGASDQHIMPFREGTVNFPEVFAALHASGYDDLFNMELPGERIAPRAIKGYKLEYLRNLFAHLYKEASHGASTE